MARHQYLITYKDGSRRHVDREEREALLLDGCLKQTGPREYHCTVIPRTFHSFADLSELKLRTFMPPSDTRRFLPGSFVFELKGRKIKELLETELAMTYRLRQQGALA